MHKGRQWRALLRYPAQASPLPDMAEGGAPNPGADGARNDWFGERVVQALHVKSEKFKKMLLSEEGGRPMLDFMINPEITRVFVTEGAKELVCFEVPPTSQKKKAIYFLKLRKEAITSENAKELVIHGDLSPGVLQHLFETTSEVYLPLLSNSHNQQGLPEVVVKDVMEYYHRLVAAVYVTSARSSHPESSHRRRCGRVRCCRPLRRRGARHMACTCHSPMPTYPLTRSLAAARVASRVVAFSRSLQG